MELVVYSRVLQDSLSPCLNKVPESVGKRALKSPVFEDLADQGASGRKRKQEKAIGTR